MAATSHESRGTHGSGRPRRKAAIVTGAIGAGTAVRAALDQCVKLAKLFELVVDFDPRGGDWQDLDDAAAGSSQAALTR
jgi:hypothetical protein